MKIFARQLRHGKTLHPFVFKLKSSPFLLYSFIFNFLFKDGQRGGFGVDGRDGDAGSHPHLPGHEGRGELQHAGHARPALPTQPHTSKAINRKILNTH